MLISEDSGEGSDGGECGGIWGWGGGGERVSSRGEGVLGEVREGVGAS